MVGSFKSMLGSELINLHCRNKLVEPSKTSISSIYIDAFGNQNLKWTRVERLRKGIECSDAFRTAEMVDKCLLPKGATELFYFMFLLLNLLKSPKMGCKDSPTLTNTNSIISFINFKLSSISLDTLSGRIMTRPSLNLQKLIIILHCSGFFLLFCLCN